MAIRSQRTIELSQIVPSDKRDLLCTKFRPIAAFLLILLCVPFADGQTDNIQERLDRASNLIRENRMADAEQQLNNILKAAPNQEIALNLPGANRAQQGRLNEEESLMTRAERIDPSFVAVHMNLAFLYVLKNAPEKAISELKVVVRLEPNNVEANYKLGRLLLVRAQIDEAIEVIERAKSNTSGTVIFLPLLGDAYLRKGNSDKAEENYLSAIAAQKDNPDALLGLAKVANSRGDTGVVLKYLAQARELAGNSPELRYKVGVTALGLGVFDEAQSDLEQAAKLKPNDPSYLIALGAALLKKADLIAAEPLFRRALELQ